MKIWKGYEVKNWTGMKESSREGTGTEEKCNRSKRNTNGPLGQEEKKSETGMNLHWLMVHKMAKKMIILSYWRFYGVV